MNKHQDVSEKENIWEIPTTASSITRTSVNKIKEKVKVNNEEKIDWITELQNQEDEINKRTDFTVKILKKRLQEAK